MPFSTWLFFASDSLLNSSAGFIVNQIGALVFLGKVRPFAVAVLIDSCA